MLIDFNNIYNICYLAITVLAFNEPLFYSILLLDIIKRSGALQNIIKAITLNVINICKFSLLGIIVMYIYGIIGYLYF
jgi:hypothetical protein